MNLTAGFFPQYHWVCLYHKVLFNIYGNCWFDSVVNALTTESNQPIPTQKKPRLIAVVGFLSRWQPAMANAVLYITVHLPPVQNSKSWQDSKTDSDRPAFCLWVGSVHLKILYSVNHSGFSVLEAFCSNIFRRTSQFKQTQGDTGWWHMTTTVSVLRGHLSTLCGALRQTTFACGKTFINLLASSHLFFALNATFVRSSPYNTPPMNQQKDSYGWVDHWL